MNARRLACALALVAFPALPQAQSLPPSVRACAAESDADRRHACYDREVGRILDAERRPSDRQSAASAGSGAAAKRAERHEVPTPAAPREAPARAEPHETVGSREAPAAAEPHETPTQRLKNVFSSAQGDSRLSARIASVDASSEQLVLRLDNGEVWEQTDRTAGGLGLRAGDAVTIEKHFGSYYLSARHVSGMRVRKRRSE